MVALTAHHSGTSSGNPVLKDCLTEDWLTNKRGRSRNHGTTQDMRDVKPLLSLDSVADLSMPRSAGQTTSGLLSVPRAFWVVTIGYRAYLLNLGRL